MLIVRDSVFKISFISALLLCMQPCPILTDHPHLGGLRDHLSTTYVTEEKASGREGSETGGEKRREMEGRREVQREKCTASYLEHITNMGKACTYLT